MIHDPIDSWVEKAKMAQASEPEASGVQVVRRLSPHNRGSLIMNIAESIRPWLMQIFEGMRDNDGMLVQPAHVRAIALGVAQDIVKDEELKGNA